MIETLINLKNNKLKRNQAQNQGAESVERLKKFLAGQAKKRHGELKCYAKYYSHLIRDFSPRT
jgi:hypothetical protein